MARGFIRERSGPKGTAFELRVYAGRDDAGQERRIYRTVRGTRKQAEIELTKLLGEVDDGGHAGPDASFAALLDQWVKLKAPKWSPKTLAETKGMIDRHIRPTLGTLRLRDVTAARLDALNARLGANLAPATVRRIHGVVHAALERAVRWDWIARNPASRCEPISVPDPEISPPSIADVRRLLAADTTLALFLRLAAVTGRRRGELCALRWSDVDFVSGAVTVSRTLVDSQSDGWVERRISKNLRRFPPIAIDAVTLGLLRAHRTASAERLLALGRALPADGFVFWRIDRKAQRIAPWSPDSVSHRFAKIRAAVDLPTMRLHDLRHFVATTLLHEGFAAVTVGGRLGHGDGGRTTEEVYAHFSLPRDREAADVMGRLLDAPERKADSG